MTVKLSMNIPLLDQSDRVQTYREIVEKCNAAKAALESLHLRFHPTSTLGKLFKTAKCFADQWEQGIDDKWDIKQLIDTGHAWRIADAILAVYQVKGSRHCLERITKKM
ncbi:hypothetical protein [Noviherbaspirillum galbum]|uniref:Uncharacterized protein n=1 Tax=Noviherbaspirillum galbum TaxID=2709383 RepID=A0A6B3SHB8_9BURK|nr:hypothetical protein [Noviherbaspirillum galbum]NEX60058.1 hypothetical protein [Noviherbaspirillum galbum]